MGTELLEEHSRSIEALSGVCDLLCLGGPEEQMEPVICEHLYFLLAMVRDRLAQTNERLFEAHFLAKMAA